MMMRSNRPLSRTWRAYNKNSIWLASKSCLINVTYALVLRVIMLNNNIFCLCHLCIMLSFKTFWTPLVLLCIMYVPIGTSVELEGVILPTGLIVNMITPYDLLTDWETGTSYRTHCCTLHGSAETCLWCGGILWLTLAVRINLTCFFYSSAVTSAKPRHINE